MNEPLKLLPHDSPLLERGPQGLTDWSTQLASDELLKPETRERLKKLYEEWLQEHGPES